MCSGVLGDRSKWRRKAEAFPARSIDRNPRRDATEDPRGRALGLKQDHGSTGQLVLPARLEPPGAACAPRACPNQASFLSLPLLLVSLSLSHFGPLWVLPEAQAGRGLRDLGIRMSDLDQMLQTSPLGKANSGSTEAGPSSPLPPASPTLPLGPLVGPQLRLAFQRDKTLGKLRSPQH